MNITKELVEQECMATLWSVPEKITPRLVEAVLGDGKKLIAFQPFMTRPNYYVIRVHSTWVLSNWSRHGELLIEHTDEIYEAIEEEYGSAHCGSCEGLYGEDNDCTECEGEEERPFPALDEGSGSGWWHLTPKELEV